MIRIQKLKLGCTEPKTHIKRDNHKIEYTLATKQTTTPTNNQKMSR